MEKNADAGAQPARRADLGAEEVAEDPVQRESLRDQVADPAVRVDEVVVLPQRRARADGHCFLPAAGVVEAGEPALTDPAEELLLGVEHPVQLVVEVGSRRRP